MLKNLEESHVITLEDNVYFGGFGAMVNGFFMQNQIQKQVKNFAYRDEFIPHGSVESLQKRFGVDEEEIKAYILSVLL